MSANFPVISVCLLNLIVMDSLQFYVCFWRYFVLFFLRCFCHTLKSAIYFCYFLILPITLFTTCFLSHIEKIGQHKEDSDSKNNIKGFPRWPSVVLLAILVQYIPKDSGSLREEYTDPLGSVLIKLQMPYGVAVNLYHFSKNI